MKQLLLRAWLTRGWLACLLWPVAQLHGWIVRLRQALYRSGFLKSERFGVPVIVVGNIVAGGAGKTPLVMALVKHLQAQGLAELGNPTAPASLIRSETESSELLYFMLTKMQVFGVPPVGESEFGTSEVRDTDGDGLLEFIDAWGRPLRF